MGIDVRLRIGADAAGENPPEPPPPPTVLELRVHGVNNTKPEDLLDLPKDAIELAAGDVLGSFWRPTDDALKKQDAARAENPNSRGFVPEGVLREAYSWGGMVRTTPGIGGSGAVGTVLAAAARVFYAVILPFSLGNAVVWTRTLAVQPSDRKELAAWRRSGPGARSWGSAGAARLFGLVLTLLFTTTAITLAMDVGAMQCAAQSSLCGPAASLLSPLEGWMSGQRLALFALAPVAAVLALWFVSGVSRVRYDVLPGMEGHSEAMIAAGTAPSAVLAQPGFWSNRVSTYLARAHLTAAVALTWFFVAFEVAAGFPAACANQESGCDAPSPALTTGAWITMWVAAAAVVLAIVLACGLPTMRIQTEEEVGSALFNRLSRWLLIVTASLFGLSLLVLAIAPTPTLAPTNLVGIGFAPLVLAGLGTVLALWGLWWRADRSKAQAWGGHGPGVFMIVSLVAALAVSAISVVAISDFLNGAKGPSTVIAHPTPSAGAAPTPSPTATDEGRVSVDWTDTKTGETGSVTVGSPLPAVADIQISPAYGGFGTVIMLGLVLAVIVLGVGMLLPRGPFSARAVAWRTAPTTARGADGIGGAAPPSVAEELPQPEGGVLPPSQKTLFGRIAGKRAFASRMHLMEPAVGVFAWVLGLAVAAGLVWVGVAVFTPGQSLWLALPGIPESVLDTVLDLSLVSLAWLGVVLTGVLAAGGSAGAATRPLGIVWDIVCFLPRTGHPFGPPCYAERAVPEIAGRVNRWLAQNDEHRAIIAAHSMGAVLSVSSIGLLASTQETRERLGRVALLTFGVQLRPFFGRLLPELLGPGVLGIHPAVPPRITARDPWTHDVATQEKSDAGRRDPLPAPPSSPAPVGRLNGTLLLPPPPAKGAVDRSAGMRWISLWRLTDYLGYPAFSTAPRGEGWENHVDRCADELDTSGYMVAVGTHGEYYRVPQFERAVEQLRDELVRAPR